MAKNACRLLDDWRQIPGSDEPGGPIDEPRLQAWIAEARRLLAEADREARGEQYIGQVLAHAWGDDDGTWPPLAVRNVIENASSDLETGFRRMTYTKRGVTSRGPDEGGAQERTLADQYDRWAESIADQWPRTAAILRALAVGYRAEGRSHDEDARRFQAGLRR